MMELSLPQIWMIIGLLMLVAELVSVVLVFIFFAVGGLVTALLAAIGLLPTLEYQIMAFSAISILTLIIFRKHARKLLEARRDKQEEYKEFVGETAMVIRDIPSNGSGKIYYRGAEWSATSNNHNPIEAGSKVVIQRTEGITLVVEES
ncbi:NfeD family protein [Dyadobacter diqingensis]|jgi:membrane protein implicated in regulation of membrane protease activity|uniref:NfeD family protein n=1 Tax=Dyadobacter diqingensis TaxID=2938121 RepID=UPI0020C2ECD7|nr:NfeD family protein [Dyadobacter diqingensis]